MFLKSLIVMVILAFSITGSVFALDASPEGAQVYIISPADGETVTSPVTVRFGLKGMGVAPAGVDMPKTGHHHLLIDLENLPALDKPLPADDQHLSLIHI